MLDLNFNLTRATISFVLDQSFFSECLFVLYLSLFSEDDDLFMLYQSLFLP